MTYGLITEDVWGRPLVPKREHFALVADLACTWCNAQPGECCRTRTGRTMGIEYHKRRRELFRVAVNVLNNNVRKKV